MTSIKEFDPDFYHDLIISNIKCHTARRRQIGKPESTAMNVMYSGGYSHYPKSFYGWAEFMPDHLEINKRLKDVPKIIIPCSQIFELTNDAEYRYVMNQAILLLPLALLKKSIHISKFIPLTK